RLSGVHRHAHREPVDRTEVFTPDSALRFDGGFERLADRPKCSAKCVADRLENIAAPRLDLRAQYLVVTAERLAHRVAVAFPAARAAFDIRKQEDDGAGRAVTSGHPQSGKRLVVLAAQKSVDRHDRLRKHGHQLGPALDVEGLEELRELIADGVRAASELSRDFGVPPAGANELEHLALRRRDSIESEHRVARRLGDSARDPALWPRLDLATGPLHPSTIVRALVERQGA